MDVFSDIKYKLSLYKKDEQDKEKISNKIFNNEIINFSDLPLKIKNDKKYKEELFACVENFRPIQIESFKNGILKGQNLVINAPTSSGKTLPVEIAAIKTVIDEHKKVIFVEPLRAITYEKKGNLENEELNIKSAIFTGEIRDKNLINKDIIYATAEMLASHINDKWVSDVGLLVIDECDLLMDKRRGSILENVITYFLANYSNIQIIMLSATLSNGKQLAEWLGGKFIKTDERPITIKYKIETRHQININNENISFVNPGTIEDFILSKPTNTLIATSSRKDSINYSLNIALSLKNNKTPEMLKYYRDICKGIEKCAYSRYGYDKYTRTESICIKDAGIAFHNAGLAREQRKLIETEFKNQVIRIIVCTPTLERGINLPVDNVVFYDFNPNKYSVSRFKQMGGRVGRPGKSKEANVYIKINSEFDSSETVNEICKNFILGEPENTISQLGENIINSLAYFVRSRINNIDKLLEVINKSLFCIQNVKFTKEILISRLDDSPDIFEIAGDNVNLTAFGDMWIKSNLDIPIIKQIQEFLNKTISSADWLSFITKLIVKNLHDNTNGQTGLSALNLWISGNRKPLDSNEDYIGTGDFKNILNSAIKISKLIKEVYLWKNMSTERWILGLDKSIEYGLNPEEYGELCSVADNKQQVIKLYTQGIRKIADVASLDVFKIKDLEGHKSFLNAISMKSKALKVIEGDSLISVHDLIDYYHCPLSFLLKKKGIKPPLDKVTIDRMRLGSSIHRHIKNITKLMLNKKEWQEYLDNIENSVEREQVINFLEYIEENNLEIIDSEREIVSEKIRLDGKIDSITVQDNSRLKLIEIKSGKFYNDRLTRDQIQIKAYGVIARTNFNYVTDLSLLYLEDKVEKEVSLNEEEISNIINKVKEVHYLLKKFNSLKDIQKEELMALCTCSSYEHENCICKDFFRKI